MTTNRTCTITPAMLRWNMQSRIPNSPGAFSSQNTYELCLGATLAEEARKRQGIINSLALRN